MSQEPQDAPPPDPLGPKFVPKKVDEDWKRKAKEESSRLSGAASPAGGSPRQAAGAGAAAGSTKASPIFLEFLTGLATQAALHLRDQDLEQARYLIEIFQVLKDRTKGALADEEQKLLDRCLYELQMQYVQIMKASSRGAKGGGPLGGLPPGGPGADPRGWEGA